MKRFIIILLVVYGPFNVWGHTIKMTTGKLNIDRKNNSCSLTINFFIDDFESELINMYPQAPFNYQTPSNEMLQTIEDYILNNVVIELNQTTAWLKLTSVNKTEENVCQVTLKGELHENKGVIKIKNTLLFSSFDKQSNVLHLFIDGEKKEILRFFAGIPIRTERI
ncbi:DUF6702 family protein [Mariniflexile sp. HMF6888]|uniref:DUF6702 family protein n=1 Tax=Mariniflexile sp. HMF6888 TaxID=3373086 RepID=UPI0037A99F2E